MRCWCAFLTPWRSDEEIAAFRLFVSRHYLFYRGLLVLVVKLVAFSQLQAKQIHEIVECVASVFSSPVLALLNACDSLLDMSERQKRCDDAALQRQSEILHEGLRVAARFSLTRRSWASRRVGR